MMRQKRRQRRRKRRAQSVARVTPARVEPTRGQLLAYLESTLRMLADVVARMRRA